MPENTSGTDDMADDNATTSPGTNPITRGTIGLRLRAENATLQAAAQHIVDDNADVIEAFLMRYICSIDIGTHLVEAITSEASSTMMSTRENADNEDANAKLFKSTLAFYQLEAAIAEVTEFLPYGGYSYGGVQTVIEGAVSFEFLVRHARSVDPTVIPPEAIPSQEVVHALLTLFHFYRLKTFDPRVAI